MGDLYPTPTRRELLGHIHSGRVGTDLTAELEAERDRLATELWQAGEQLADARYELDAVQRINADLDQRLILALGDVTTALAGRSQAILDANELRRRLEDVAAQRDQARDELAKARATIAAGSDLRQRFVDRAVEAEAERDRLAFEQRLLARECERWERTELGRASLARDRDSWRTLARARGERLDEQQKTLDAARAEAQQLRAQLAAVRTDGGP